MLSANPILKMLFSAIVIFPVNFLQIEFKSFPIVTQERLELTRQYCKKHYGLDSYRLADPEIIVIHYTAIPTLKATLRTFKPAKIDSHRTYIKKFGELNVGVHFVVDKNGDIYSLLPEDVIGRHTIGFNHVALGVENVAGGKNELTQEQLKSTAWLVVYLARKYPSIHYLIGHYEYMKEQLPHFILFKELDENYKPTIKGDPGDQFMQRLRVMLKDGYEIELEK